MTISDGDRQTFNQRGAGVLLHPTSLGGDGGIGDLGRAAHRFLDWLRSAGQSVWQVLPFNEPGYAYSPYGAASSYAGSRFLISLETLVEEDLLTAGELAATRRPVADQVDYEAVRRWKEEALRRAWAAFPQRASRQIRESFEAFSSRENSAAWLDDWSLYVALKKSFGGSSWQEWPAALRSRAPRALAEARSSHRQEIEYQKFVQFIFYRQWDALHDAAREKDIRIFGDMPIYPAPDSADVWANQEIFDLDGEGRLLTMAGVPPDYFSSTGQLWGNPTYRWQLLADRGFDWWVDRFAFLLRHVDVLRLDHFRGFCAFWRVPRDAEDARGGEWVEAPGAELFAAVRRELGSLPLVAEDLGVITPDVVALRERFGFPGMKVLQFAFDDLDSEHLPHHHTPDSVVYTATHDNNTIRGWSTGLAKPVRRRLHDYLGAGGEGLNWSMIRAAHCSVGRLAVVPAQDLLDLGREARMNTPGNAGGNWTWRLRPDELDGTTAERLHRLTEITGRLPPEPAAADAEKAAAVGAGKAGAGAEPAGAADSRESGP